MHIHTQTTTASIRNTYLVSSVTAECVLDDIILFSYWKEVMFICKVPTATYDYTSHSLFWVICYSSLLPSSFASLSNTIFSYLFTAWLPKFLDCSLRTTLTPNICVTQVQFLHRLVLKKKKNPPHIPVFLPWQLKNSH